MNLSVALILGAILIASTIVMIAGCNVSALADRQAERWLNEHGG